AQLSRCTQLRAADRSLLDLGGGDARWDNDRCTQALSARRFPQSFRTEAGLIAGTELWYRTRTLLSADRARRTRVSGCPSLYRNFFRSGQRLATARRCQLGIRA